MDNGQTIYKKRNLTPATSSNLPRKPTHCLPLFASYKSICRVMLLSLVTTWENQTIDPLVTVSPKHAGLNN